MGTVNSRTACPFGGSPHSEIVTCSSTGDCLRMGTVNSRYLSCRVQRCRKCELHRWLRCACRCCVRCCLPSYACRCWPSRRQRRPHKMQERAGLFQCTVSWNATRMLDARAAIGSALGSASASVLTNTSVGSAGTFGPRSRRNGAVPARACGVLRSYQAGSL